MEKVMERKEKGEKKNEVVGKVSNSAGQVYSKKNNNTQEADRQVKTTHVKTDIKQEGTETDEAEKKLAKMKTNRRK